MSTDLYGARVLAVAPDRMSVRMRIFVVYYEASSQEALDLPGPDDEEFFREVLRLEGSREEFDDEEQDAFYDSVQSVQRVAERNAELRPEDWEHVHDFYYERHGGWLDEHRLVQADYVVRVSEPRWLADVEPGRAWGTTSFLDSAIDWGEPDEPAAAGNSSPAAGVIGHLPARAADAGAEEEVGRGVHRAFRRVALEAQHVRPESPPAWPPPPARPGPG
ncbi:hypothetical protein [Nonomuraea fuscirosea]|uniref:hypothetical protein n=1 Tax=Nonomuraea fuscirosea TaxID=1291556 RepID=UPI0034191A49